MSLTNPHCNSCVPWAQKTRCHQICCSRVLDGSATCILSWLSMFVTVKVEDSYIASLRVYGNIEGISCAVVISRKCKTVQAVSGICQ